MKKAVLFLIALAVFLPVSFAETKIFSGSAVTDSDKVIDGGIFRFRYDEASDKVFAQTPAGSLIVDNGGCKSNSVFRVCINRANFSHKNITTYVYYYEVNADIYKLTGSLTTNTSLSPSELLQGEIAEFKIIILNPTDFDIANIDFSYDLAPFYASESKGCGLNNGQMQWKGSLQPKYDKVCTATIVAGKEGAYRLSGNLSYFNGFETEKKATDALAIKVLPKQLKVSHFIDKNIEAKKPFYFNISLQNIHPSEDMDVISTITLPSHASLIKDTPIFEKNARVLKRRLALRPGTGANYSLYIEKISEGREPINLRFEYTIKGISDSLENSTFIDIIGAQPINKSEPEAEEKRANETTGNLTATKDIQDMQDMQVSQQISENQTNKTGIEGNKPTEIATIGVQESKPFNRGILALIAVILVAFVAVIFLVFRARKGKEGSS